MSASQFRRRFALVAAVVTLGLATAATAADASGVGPAATSPTISTQYAVNEPVCARPADPTAMRCFAMRRVAVSKGTRGAYAYRPNTVGVGPNGGYTPDDLAAAYDYDATVNRASQLVGIVDWYDDPSALTDLNTFDTQYGLPHETSTSFRKVNQRGATAPLPKADKNSSVEIALDIESVRGVCHTCRILLVEADHGVDADLAAAENEAVAQGATEISNSFGEPEHPVSASVLAAFNHPGVVITVATGDDGWYGWDYANNDDTSQGAANFPSTDPDVVSVGGTTLVLNGSGQRSAEIVWNENGVEDGNGHSLGAAQGATGGGCSTLYAAPAWQAHFPGYSAAGCGGKRLAADVSVIADPHFGFDIIDTFDSASWQTIGGTSLSSPVTAALFALAGGSGGAAYPAASLYANATARPASLFDVVPDASLSSYAQGNGYCGGNAPGDCGNDTDSMYHTHNPNALGGGNVDCSFPRNTTDPASPPALSTECNTVTGYDGPTGVGTPNNDSLYTPTSPAVSVTRPSVMKLHTSEPFSAKVTEPVSGVHATTYAWNWGDGHSTTTTSAATHHTYTAAGAYAVTVTVTDSAYQAVTRATHVTVGKKATVHLTGPSKLRRGKKGSFGSRGTSDPNTGAKITKVTWKWGDGHSTQAAMAKHAYKKAGTYKITVVFVDSTGVTTTAHKQVKVRA